MSKATSFDFVLPLFSVLQAVTVNNGPLVLDYNSLTNIGYHGKFQGCRVAE